MKIKYKIPTSLEHTWPIIVRYIALLGLVIAVMSVTASATSWFDTGANYRIEGTTLTRYGTMSLNISNSCGTNNATWVFACGAANFSYTDNYTVQTNLRIRQAAANKTIYFRNISDNNSLAQIYFNTSTTGTPVIYLYNTNYTFNNSLSCTHGGIFRFCNDFEGSSIAGNWTASAGTITQTGNGYLRFVSATGNLERAASAYSPDAAGSWAVLADIAAESTVDGYGFVGQTGTASFGSLNSPQIQFGNIQGNGVMNLYNYNAAGTTTPFTTAATFWDRPTNVSVEVRKTPGTAQAYLYTQGNNFVERQTSTTNVPASTNPLGLYEANSLPLILNWFAVSDYNTSDGAFTSWSQVESLWWNTKTNDQTLNFTVNDAFGNITFYLNSTQLGIIVACDNDNCPWWRINGVTQDASQGSSSMSTSILQNSTITVTSIDSGANPFTITWIVNVTDVPELIYPMNGTTISGVFPPINQDVNFSWYGSAATNFQVAADSTFNILQASITTGSNDYIVGLGNGTHYWRARHYNTTTETYGDFSNYESFVITTTTPSLTGTVLNGVVYELIGSTQTPVSGASVYLTNSTDTLYFLTGSNGYFEFESLASSTYSIYAIKQNYDNSQVFAITPVSGATNTLNIPMRIYISPYVPNFVFEKFVVRSLFDDPYTGVTVNIFVNGNAAPSFSGVTDSMGQVVFQLVKDTYYRAEFSGGGLSSTVVDYFYGKEEVYLLSIASGFPTGGDKNEDINATLYVTQINSTHANLSLYYSDNSSTTTSINFYAKYYANQTAACATQNTAVYPVTLNCTVVMNNLTYLFGYNSTSSKYGLSQKDKIVNFAANNASAPQIIGNKVDPDILNWLSIIGLIFVAGLFSVKTNKFGVVIVPLLATTLYWFGALNVSGAIVHMALVLGILVYIRMSEPKVTA